jgi:hypothetical protein
LLWIIVVAVGINREIRSSTDSQLRDVPSEERRVAERSEYSSGRRVGCAIICAGCDVVGHKARSRDSKCFDANVSCGSGIVGWLLSLLVGTDVDAKLSGPLCLPIFSMLIPIPLAHPPYPWLYPASPTGSPIVLAALGTRAHLIMSWKHGMGI